MILSLQHWFDNLIGERPLGWKQLIHKKTRLMIAITGVGFANVLMFAQLGIRAALFEGITLIHEHLQGDLFLVSSFSPRLGFQQFPRIYLYQADAVSGVTAASPLYIREVQWINPEKLVQPNKLAPATHASTASETNTSDSETVFPDEVKILAFNPVQPVFKIPEVNQQLSQLQEPDTVLFDRLAQPSLGPIPDLLGRKQSVATIMDNRRTHVVGLFTLGSTLFTKGYVIMSDWNYATRFGRNSLKNVSVGVLTLDPGADPLHVQAQLKATLPSSVRVLTPAQLIEQENAFWAQAPSGIVLNFGAAMGFIVGVIVVYQVLYADVTEHLPEYATLKAIGYADRLLLIVVMQEAMILAVLGFLPGCMASVGVYGLLSSLTKIPLTLRPDVAVQVFLLTLVMCGVSGAIATQKLRTADPADVF